MPGRRRGWWRTGIGGSTMAFGQSLRRPLHRVPSLCRNDFCCRPCMLFCLSCIGLPWAGDCDFLAISSSCEGKSADRGTRAPLAASWRKAAALDEQPDYSAHLPRPSSASYTECSLTLSTCRYCARRSASRLRRVRRVQRTPPTSVSSPSSLLHALGGDDGASSSSVHEQGFRLRSRYGLTRTPRRGDGVLLLWRLAVTSCSQQTRGL